MTTKPKHGKKKPKAARGLQPQAKEGAPVLVKTPTRNKSKRHAKPQLKTTSNTRRQRVPLDGIAKKPSLVSNKQRSKVKQHGKAKASIAKGLKVGSEAYNQRMKELGLVDPATASPKQFRKLQKQYYDKLERQGFDDIEWVDHKTGKGHNSDYLKRSASMGRAWRPEKAEFFRLLRNFVAHYEFRTKRDRIAMELLAEGKSFRKILAHLRNKCSYRKSLYSLFYYIHELLKQCQKFNLEHKEGLLNPANADSFTDDALMADLHMQKCHLGLPVDAGWFDENLSQYYDRANSN